MLKNPEREFSVIVERDLEGYYVASVPTLPGCHTQARSLDKLTDRIREAIALYGRPPAFKVARGTCKAELS